MTVAQRLCDSGHYAASAIRLHANKLDKEWRTFATALDDRNTVLSMSVSFHKKAYEVCYTPGRIIVITLSKIKYIIILLLIV